MIKVINAPDFDKMSRKQLAQFELITHNNAVKIKTDAAINVMRRAKRPTGWLASHIAAYTNRLGKQIIGIIQTENTPYAAFIEYGSRDGKFQGYHYLKDAYEKYRPRWISELRRVFK
jgi:hypothetical protein